MAVGLVVRFPKAVTRRRDGRSEGKKEHRSEKRGQESTGRSSESQIGLPHCVAADHSNRRGNWSTRSDVAPPTPVQAPESRLRRDEPSARHAKRSSSKVTLVSPKAKGQRAIKQAAAAPAHSG